jgi:CheY-like chemotaxis protein/anti-sigma regulatory factor (Ser/Thr protein kinase)
MIQKGSVHLLQLVNDILDLSKIEAGKLELEQATVPVRQLAREVLDLLTQRAEDKGLSLSFAIDGGIPDQILTDPVRLKQALVNLVGNAIKFTDRGSIRITASADREKEQITFAVSDTGIGIDAEAITRLFQPFMQADNSMTRRFGGTGLGLAITRRIAELLGGTITVASVPGQGSTFYLTVSTGSLDGVQIVHAADPFAATPATRPKTLPTIDGRVLIVDDSRDNLELLVTLLERAGAEVSTASDGKEGLDETLRAWKAGLPYNVVLMDMQMPVLDGYTAVRQLRAAGYAGQIIALTAHAMRGELDRCLEIGCDHYLSKPIQREDLIREVAFRVRQGKPRNPDTADRLA